MEGVLIRYDEGYDPLDEEQRVKGAKWRVNPLLGYFISHVSLMKS